MKFVKAKKSQAKLRLALAGPSGSGKTWTSLAIASGLGSKIAVIDTERGSASLYADTHEFDVLELDSFSPDKFIDAIHCAESAGYETIIIDSLSHAWMGKDGALEMVDNEQKKARSGNSFTAWRNVTPRHNALVDAIIGSKCHIISTLRTKTEWVMEDDGRGKKVPRKVGLDYVQRANLEYEYTIVGDLDHEHNLVISKTRYPDLADKVVSRPGKILGEQLREWLNSGEAAIAKESEPSPVTITEPTSLTDMQRVRDELSAITELMGGKDRVTGILGSWPRSLSEAKSAVEKLKQIHTSSLDKDQIK